MKTNGYIGKKGDIILFVIFLFFLSFILWANLATLDKVISTQGKVIASEKNQIIQNLEGGIIRQILVKEGDVVEKDEVLLIFDQTFLTAELDSASKQLENLNKELDFSEESLYLVEEEINLLNPAVEQGAASRMELIRSLQKKKTAETNLLRIKTNIQVLEEKIPALADKVKRTEVKAPKKGIINRVSITTTGGVADPGSELLEIVPIEEKLILEVEVSPKDIAYVIPGQKALIKLTAFDFSKFGSLQGKVVTVGADSIAKNDGSLWYVCKVEVLESGKTSLGKEILLLPGMVAQVDIVNGERTVMDYLLEPVSKVADEAFREI